MRQKNKETEETIVDLRLYSFEIWIAIVPMKLK